MPDDNQDMIDRYTKICICKAISKSTRKKIIRDGADTLEKVQKATLAGSGSCGGKRCTSKVLQLLEEYKQELGDGE